MLGTVSEVLSMVDCKKQIVCLKCMLVLDVSVGNAQCFCDETFSGFIAQCVPL